MDPVEEQQQELEVLESIYPDELTVESETCFSVRISLDTQSQKSHTLMLNVKYPPLYPEEVPELSLEVEEYELDDEDDDSDEDEEAKAHTRNINLPEQVIFESDDLEKILHKLNEEAEMQIGIPSIFAIVTLTKDEGEQLFKDKLAVLERKREVEISEQEAELSKKFIGTKVTKDSFEAWRKAFREELGVDEKLQQFYKSQHNGKLSGREMFEKGLAREDDLVEGIDGLSV